MFNIMSDYFQKSSLLIGVTILFMNIGGNSIRQEIPDYIDEIINTPILRRFFIFALVLIYTKDIAASIVVTLLFVIVFTFLLNNKSRYCILSEKYKERTTNRIYKSEIVNCLGKINKYLEQDNTDTRFLNF